MRCSSRRRRLVARISASLVAAAASLALSGCASTAPSSSNTDLPDAARAGKIDERAANADGRGVDGADDPPGTNTRADEPEDTRGAISERVRRERREAFNPYVITAHRHNYVLPLVYTSALNESIYRREDVPLREGLAPVEVKFQVSLKTQLNERDLFLKNDSLHFGLTIEAWWQLYASDLSSPFRETNYTPEIFYLKPLLWGPFGGSTALVFGLEHQSNGQVQGLSRSWNRLYAAFVYERGNFVASARPWYRIPEGDKDSPDDAAGDDNPDILDFMGHGELKFAWRDSRYEYTLQGRGNPETGKGAVTLGMTFPLFARFRGFVRYFNGYGDSLVDYDHFQARLGLGFALTGAF